MKEIFFGELEHGQVVGISLGSTELEYTIINIYSDGLKVQYEKTVIERGNEKVYQSIILIPFTSIKYVRVK